MATPSWYESLPEAMSEAEYQALPEEIARTIEVVHGHVIKCESPAPQHNRIARRLANALEAARPASGPPLSVETGIDKEFHLDAVASEYRLHRIHQSDLDLELPIRLSIPFLVLTAP